MTSLDPLTLWTAAAVLHGFAAVVWGLLGGFYRIAPRASLWLCLGELLMIPTLPCSGCSAFWPGTLGLWLPSLLHLAGLLVIMLGVARLLRLLPPRLLLWVAPMVAAVLALLVRTGATAALSLLDAAAALVALATAVLLWRHSPGELMPKGGRLALALPFALLAAEALGSMPSLADQAASRAPVLSLLLIGVHLWLTLNLMILAVHRLWLRIHHLSQHDALTGTLNRRALEERLAQAQARQRRGEGFAWIALDIDNFKRINDQLGHAAGDAALQHVAALLSQQRRAGDALARLGGEEFGLLLPNTGLAAAVALAERLRRSLLEHPLHWQGLAWPMSASFGVAATAAGESGDAATLLDRADQLLYRAKQAGRNCVRGDTAETA